MNGNGSLIEMIDVAEDQARRAANNVEPAVLPPIAVFQSREGWQAREQDLYKGLALSVECDERPDEARWKLEEILGPATSSFAAAASWVDPADGSPHDKLHLHWRLQKPAMDRDALTKLKQARELAAAIVGADPTNVPIVHCLRWPGSWHRKGEPRLCEIFSRQSRRRDRPRRRARRVASSSATSPAAQFRNRIDNKPGGLEQADRRYRRGSRPARQHRPPRRPIHQSGMSAGAAVNQLRGLMDISAAREARPAEWQGRRDDIIRAVETAEEKYAPRPEPEKPKPQPEPSALDDVVATFDKWIELENHEPIYVTLGAVAANYLPGPPVWLGLVAPPASAKTEILNSLSRLDKVQLATTMSPAALLSGTPKKQVHKEAKGGLLRDVGAFGILVLKDFTSVLGLHKDDLSAMLDALREIYDGKWVRHLGTEGGRKLYWEGKLGLVFGCTEAYRLPLCRHRHTRRPLRPLSSSALKRRSG